MPVRASVIIPTRNRWDKLQTCLEHFARQTERAFEVIVADDGSDEPAPRAIEGTDRPFGLTLLRPGRVGIGPAKNAAVTAARGELLIFTNDDTYPTPGFVAEHLAAAADAGDRRWMTLGATGWRAWPDATLFDALVAETGMIFFYDALEPGGLYDFRNAWNCNLSLPRSAFEAAGGFNERLGPFFFEDLELAWRMGRTGWQVRYWPAAAATHDHRYTPQGYLDRERTLGAMAPHLWRANPECFEAVYRGPLDDAFVAYARRFLADHGRMAGRFAEHFRQWADWPAALLDRPPLSRTQWLDLFVHAHRVLKRVTFYRGLLGDTA